MDFHRTWRRLLLAAIAMGAHSAWSEDDGDPKQGGVHQLVAASSADEALWAEQRLDMAAGDMALQDMEENPHRGIDAAIWFGKVLSLDQALDLPGQENANSEDSIADRSIYFCGKAMEASDAKAYLLTRSTSEQEAFKQAERVLAQEKSQGAEYAANLAEMARNYDRNKNGYLDAIVVDYELLDLFSGMTFKDDINQEFSRAQERYADQLAQEQERRDALAEERLARHDAGLYFEAMKPTGDLLPIPSASDQAMALSTITAHYGVVDGMSVARQRSIARRLAADADLKHASPAGVYAMLQLSERLAQASEEYATLLSDIAMEAGQFAGINADHKARAALTAMGKPAAKAALKLLLDNYDDTANSTLGLVYIGQLGHWKEGMQMVSIGSDQHLKAAVRQEWQQPTTTAQLIAMGDTWYAIGQKAALANRGGLWARAEMWYQRVEFRVTGKELQHVTANLQTIDAASPEAVEDWSAITPAEFSRLRGQSLLLDAHVGQLDTGIALKADQSVRVVVAPLDCWHWTNPVGQATTVEACSGYDVKVLQPVHGQGDVERQGVLTMGLDNGDHVTFGLVTGPGELWLYAENPESLVGSGTARIIILPDPDG